MIAWFARNSVAANLLLVTIVLSGLLGVKMIRLDLFPDAEPNVISVRVVLRGATPEDVELGVATRIEEAVQDIEGIEKITSVSVEGSTRVRLEIESGYDPREILDDVKPGRVGLGQDRPHISRTCIAQQNFVPVL